MQKNLTVGQMPLGSDSDLLTDGGEACFSSELNNHYVRLFYYNI
jgi:hypothetical protein